MKSSSTRSWKDPRRTVKPSTRTLPGALPCIHPEERREKNLCASLDAPKRFAKPRFAFWTKPPFARPGLTPVDAATREASTGLFSTFEITSVAAESSSMIMAVAMAISLLPVEMLR